MRSDNYYRLRQLISEGVTKVKEQSAQLGVSERQVLRLRSKLKASGFDPENDRYHQNPETHPVSGYSTLVRMKDKEDGSTGKVLEWVKTNAKLSDQIDAAARAIDTLIREVTPVPEVKYKGRKQCTELFTVIPLGDPHIGLKVWESQTGEKWGIDSAKRVYSKILSRILTNSPDTDEVILVNTGDLFHADNIAGVTSRSGHRLDLDGHIGEWLDAGMVIMRMIVDACLDKYRIVHFVNVPGNHDDLLGRMMGGFIEQVYLHNPRVSVQKGDNPFQYVHRGNVLLGFAHGHTCRLSSLPGKMADDQYRLWGQTTYRHWITGHVHHNQWLQFKEHPGCSVETVGIVAPKDAYAHGGAYGAGRTLQAIIFDSAIGYSPVRITENVRSTD